MGEGIKLKKHENILKRKSVRVQSQSNMQDYRSKKNSPIPTVIRIKLLVEWAGPEFLAEMMAKHAATGKADQSQRDKVSYPQDKDQSGQE